jgi:tetratricopeptide (TPR) repeat protein
MKTGWMLVPALAFLGVRAAVLAQMGDVDSGVTGLLQNSLTTTDSIITRIATAASIQWLYFEKLLIPFQLSSDYSYNAIPLAGFSDIAALLGLLVTAALIVVGVRTLQQQSPIGFGVLFYFITISVVANLFILIGAMAAERFLFTPSLGWSIALCAFVYEWKPLRSMRTYALVGFSVLFIAISLTRIPDWKDEYTLFTEDVKYVDESARAHYNAGSASNTRAKTQPQEAVTLRADAVKHLRTAIQIWPEYQDAYNNLGVVYLDAGDLSSAYSSFKTLMERFPSYTKGVYNFGYTCYKMQRYAEAESTFERYYTMNPSNDVLYLIAECEGFQNKFDEAKAHLNQLIELEPQNGRGYLKLGMAHAITGDLQAAEEVLLAGCQVAPREPELFFNLGLLRYNTQRYAEAIAPLQQALSIKPDHQRANQLLTQVQAFNGQNQSQ